MTSSLLAHKKKTLRINKTISGRVLDLFFLNYFCFILLLLFLAALGLRCCTRAFPSCDERGLLFAVVHGLLIAVASLVVEHRL